MIVVKDEIRALIMSIQSTGTIDTFTNNGDGTYTIITSYTGNLEEDFKLLLIFSDTTLNRDVIIDSVTSTTIIFSCSDTLTTPVSWEMALYFEPGHRLEINKKYANKAKSINKLVQEYPLVWLYTDFEQRPSERDAADFQTTLQFAIVDFSDKESYEDKRLTETFKPVLYPLLELIDSAFNGIYKRKFVTIYGATEIDLLFVDRPFFGSADKTGNVLPDPTDAIEFQVELHWRNQNGVCTGY